MQPTQLLLATVWYSARTGTAFVPSRVADRGIIKSSSSSSALDVAPANDGDPTMPKQQHLLQGVVSRRHTLQAVLATAAASVVALPAAAEEESIFAPGFVQEYEDFTSTPNGWSYRDITTGNGAAASLGDRVVYDWSGYTIGYFGRPFQAKGGPVGGAFDKEVDYYRTVLGSSSIVPAVEQALVGMQPRGVRQVIVPYKNGLSYPPDDPSHDRVGPKPTTFSGQRALNFVLENPRIDRTLLFNIKVVRVDKPDGKGGFTRG